MGAMARIQRLLLPVGLPAALIFGVFAPRPGLWVDAHSWLGMSWSNFSILVVFLINGIQMPQVATHDRALVRAAVQVCVLNLVVAPAIVWVLFQVVDLPLGAAVPLALMASVPTTLSSATVTGTNAGGDRLWSLVLTVACVLAGSVTAPIAVGALLGSSVSISVWPLLSQVLELVLLPVAVGWALRRWVWRRPPSWLGMVPSLAVMSVVWVTMSRQSETVRALAPSTLALIAVVAVVGHAGMLAMAWLAARGRSWDHAMPVLFVTAQKTLPMALTILVILGDQSPEVAAVSAVATVACVAWHFTQVFGDSVLAARLLRSAPTAR